MNQIFGREPVLILAVIQTFVTCLTVFGLDLTEVQQGAIIGLSAAVLGLIARSRVTPVK